MRKTTVRFSPSIMALIQEEAEREGVSAAEFIRQAAFGRAAFRAGLRRDERGLEMERLIREKSR